MSATNNLDLQNVPRHVAFIMDGNGRWAKKQGQHRLFGHAAGVESVKAIIQTAREIGVAYITLYAFSTENWARPSDEVEGLMNLLVDAISNEVDEMHANGVRLLTIGDIKGLPGNCYDSLCRAMDRTKDNTALTLILALNYSARQEILQAAATAHQMIETKQLQAEDLTEEVFSSLLQTKDIPDPELLIRTSGECRISNCLPDFRRDSFLEAIANFQKRERRFGMVSEQIQNTK